MPVDYGFVKGRDELADLREGFGPKEIQDCVNRWIRPVDIFKIAGLCLSKELSIFIDKMVLCRSSKEWPAPDDRLLLTRVTWQATKNGGDCVIEIKE